VQLINQSNSTIPRPIFYTDLSAKMQPTFAHRLAKIAKTAAQTRQWLYHRYGDIKHASLLLLSAACKAKKSKLLSHFCIFLVQPSIDLKPNYFFQKPTNRRFQRYIVRPKKRTTGSAR